MTRLLWYLRDTLSKLWASASLYGVVAVATALAAIYLKKFIPEGLSQKIGAEAVDSILNILASSMLSVTIFSLSTMVAAYASVTNNITPRATRLLIEDKVSHSALSTFLGTFIFSIVGIILLKMGVYGDNGRLIIYVVTIGIIVMIILTLLRWIEYLTHLGRVGETIDRVESAAKTALEKRLRIPYLGGTPLETDKNIPPGTQAVRSSRVGHVQHIDMSYLSKLAESHELDIYVCALPGSFLDSQTVLAHVAGSPDPDILSEISSGFIKGNSRSFRQDPRFGLTVLHEIASKALSPAIHDPGTALEAIEATVRILNIWQKRNTLADDDYKVMYPRVHVAPLKLAELFDDFFSPVARDGAGMLEVQIRLQRAYGAFIQSGDKDLIKAAEFHSKISLERAKQALALDHDFHRLEEAMQEFIRVPNSQAPNSPIVQ